MRTFLRLRTFRFSSENQQQNVIDILKTIKLEDGTDIYSKGYVNQVSVNAEKNVVVELKLTQDYRKLKALTQVALGQLKWAQNIEIKMAPKQDADSEKKPFKRGNMETVGKIIAVSSCKGGVGKSTVAVNLAFQLHKMGLRIGIYDADVYGPSLPTLIGKEKEELRAPEDRPKDVIPVEFDGVKTMSYGYASGGRKAVMRGPMVSSVVTQLAFQTQWGELDYLVVDMPPGTGDIQITLCQELKFDAAVIVTTPQRLSFIDVVKGMEMFDLLRVPTVAVVENMAEFSCNGCGQVHRPFGPGYLSMLKNQFGIKHSVSIPLQGDVSRFSDLGSPVVMTLPESHEINQIYQELARGVVEEMKKVTEKQLHVRYETGKHVVIVRTADGKEKAIKAHELRKLCNCALCVDEWTGVRKLQQVQDDVYPHKIEPKGNYAVAMIWSDGHKSSIYPYERLLSKEIPSV